MGEFARFDATPNYTGPDRPTASEGAAAVPPPAAPGAQTIAEAPPAERPAWLPEKFKSPEDLAKAYGELERSRTAPAATPEGTPAVAPDVAGLLTDAELDQYAQEFVANGDLSAESYKALTEGKKIPRKLVDAYLAGQRAEGQRVVNQVYEATGGKEEFAAMQAWMQTAYTPADVEVFNRAMQSGNEAEIMYAARAARARYVAGNPGADTQAPARTLGGSAATGGDMPPFESQAQVTAAMKDPRYKSDPAFRAKVQKRLERSNY